jgi:hypothetical protein
VDFTFLALVRLVLCCLWVGFWYGENRSVRRDSERHLILWGFVVLTVSAATFILDSR